MPLVPGKRPLFAFYINICSEFKTIFSNIDNKFIIEAFKAWQ